MHIYQYAENASSRLDLLVEAFTSRPNPAALDFLYDVNAFSKKSAKYLQSIKDYQEGMLWERPEIRFPKPHCIDPGGNLEGIEMLIRGLEIALTSWLALPMNIVDQQEVKDSLQSMRVKINLKLDQAKCFLHSDAVTVPETKGDLTENFIWRNAESPALFFLYCMELLCNDTMKKVHISSNDADKAAKPGVKKIWKILVTEAQRERLVFASECAASLGLAVLFGLIYNKEEGYWSGLTIAISFATGSQATFTTANARAQGTAMGSVYGILCCFILHRCVAIRFLPLLPWIIFTSSLRHSRMYGQAGSISAVIGALLILGRTHYGSPSQFGIARIAEAIIGLICFVTVHTFLHPVRAATLAKAELSQTLRELRDFITNIEIGLGQKSLQVLNFQAVREQHKRVESHVNALQKFVEEAEMEPNFWFRPFHGTCYLEILRSLTKMMDILLFIVYQSEFLPEMSQKFGDDWKEIQEPLNDDLHLFKERVGSLLKCLQEVILIKSLPALDEELKKRYHDLELEKSRSANVINLDLNNNKIEEVTNSFSLHSRELASSIYKKKVEEKLKRQMILCLSGLGFCISRVMRETVEIENRVKELLKWGSPTTNINLHQISCKINAMYKE